LDKNKFLRTVAVILIVGTAWVLLEWLFFVTKPSFMSLYSAGEKFSVLASTSLIVSTGLLLASLPFIACSMLVDYLVRRPLVTSLVAFLPAYLLMAVACLVVIDNFTLTLFGWGIRDSSGLTLLLYRLLTIELLVFSAWWLHGFMDGRQTTGSLVALTVPVGVVLLISLPLLWVTSARWVGSDDDSVQIATVRPNIVILASDGVAANRMSIYGYHRPTTPFMDSAREEFLIAENHFTNAGDTGGSVISLLTGKLPTTTRVIYPPDVLSGPDSFEHLPGLLDKQGYYNVDISMRHYADPYDLNLRSGFHRANFRQLKKSGGTLVSALRNYPVLSPTSLLLDRMSERMTERFEHIWKNRKMPNPLAGVNLPDERWIRDPRRMEEIRKTLETAPRPFFLNVHMMGTHGEVFRPRKRIYSDDADYPNKWSVNGYDDAVIDFDRYVEETYNLLRALDLLDSTILIVSSDHGVKHDSSSRLPMLMRLPGREKTGLIPGNTQRLDIAPTILDVMGIEVPSWMEGRSMLRPFDPEREQRAVIAVGSSGDKSAVGNFWSVRSSIAPWYSLGQIYLVYCDQWFNLQLETMVTSGARVPGSTLSCDEAMTNKQAQELMFSHLREKGYSWE
jgi:arylsulfatase A-like enzyme